ADSGNDVAFSGSQGAQSGPRYFLGRFASSVRMRWMAGELVKLRLGCARTQGTDADAVRLHLFGQTFREKQIEHFGRSVRRNVRNGLERSGGRDDEHVASLSRNHVRQIEPCEVEYSTAIHLNHVEQALRLNRREFSELAKPGVIDEKFYGDSLLLRE